MTRPRLVAARRACLRGLALVALLPAALLAALPALAGDAVQAMRDFVRDAKSGRADFTQTVVSPDGVRKRVSAGSFEFARPDRFRFEYKGPFEQLIVADGQKVWTYDPELNQATSRRLSQALGSTPAALLAGGGLDAQFELKPEASRDGIDWALATPRDRDGSFQSMRVGFRGGVLAAIEVLDGFGQRSVLTFSGLQTNVPVADERFRFRPPKGADVIEQ